MAQEDPNLWQLPKWNPYWDGEFVFASLRSFALSVLSHTELTTRLNIIEEGYAELEVFRRTMKIGLVYVNRSEKASVPQLSFYAGKDEDEFHTTDINAALAFLETCHTIFPKDAA